MNPADFKLFEELLKKESGLVVTPEKTYLLESRLIPVADKMKLKGLEGIAEALRPGKNPELQRMVIEAMTTNETSFFRDISPFDRMKLDVLPYITKARETQKSLRIWSAACSSGQEPYSLAMVIREFLPSLRDWKIEILATDLSHDILAQAKSGIYSQFEVQRGLPVQMLVKYFSQQKDYWHVKPELKDMITFKPANLLTDIGSFGHFDIIFCRNVLIYFDVPTKNKVLQSLKQVLKPDGVLFLGGAETVIGVTEAFKALMELKGVYVRCDFPFTNLKDSLAASQAQSTAAAK